jgi:hypothetical protein
MDAYDFKTLELQFPEIVAKMESDEFTSHQFILKLAHENQADYIDALYEYKRRGNPTPFKIVHGILMKRLKTRSDLVSLESKKTADENIFKNDIPNALWKKVMH